MAAEEVHKEETDRMAAEEAPKEDANSVAADETHKEEAAEEAHKEEAAAPDSVVAHSGDVEVSLGSTLDAAIVEGVRVSHCVVGRVYGMCVMVM